MGLRDISFKPDYYKGRDNIAESFYLPAMRSSVRYDRISGYFGSTVYIIAWSALEEFISNNGKIRLICSPILSEQDKKAIENGYDARNQDFLYKRLSEELDEMFATPSLSKPFNLLACLIAKNILDIKIAIPKSGTEPDLDRLFHDKIGIFTDKYGDSVGFRGSMNETFQGLSEDGNIESIDVFTSWQESRDTYRVKTAQNYFNLLWEKKKNNTLVYDFPDAIKNKIVEKYSRYNWRSLLKEITVTLSLQNKWRANKKDHSKQPRDHQIEALENWEKHGRRGILEHATGSGKTYTAICAISNALNRGKSVLVIVPSKELLSQWEQEITHTLDDPSINILPCGDGKNSWKKEFTLQLWTKENKNLKHITIAILATASSQNFINNVTSGPHLLMVVDEVHRAGSQEYKNIFKINAGERLGLSATPRRYGDPEGTKIIFDYFGGIIPPVFSLLDAIKSNILTRYYYFPCEVHLLPDETARWIELTKKINKFIASKLSKSSDVNDIIRNSSNIKMKLIERARIVKEAAEKINLAYSILRNKYKPGQKWIVYCDNQTQLNKVLSILLKNNFDAFKYYSEMKGDRQRTLKYFEDHGGILVSIRCLDEGVDIPSTTHALILASSKNPREFIQRRGRILRKFPGKYCAYLYDAIVVPEKEFETEDKTSSIIENELSRAIEFGSWAENPSCIYDLKNIAISYGIKFNEVKDRGIED